MSPSLAIVTCGPGVTATPGVAAIDTPLAAVQAEELNAIVANGDSEWILFVDAAAESMIDSESLTLDSETVGLLITNPADGIEFGHGAWMRLFDPVAGIAAAVRRTTATAEALRRR